MGPLDALWHLLNLLTAPVAVGLLAAVAAKLLWRRELASVRLGRLAAYACVVGAVVTVGGLVWFGRDGRMATYAALVVSCSLALWWAAFGPGRRR